MARRAGPPWLHRASSQHLLRSLYRRADGNDTELLKLVREHDTLDALQTYAVLAGCDYDTKCPGVGPAAALQLMRKHGTDLGAIAREKPLAADWAVKLQNGVDCFRGPGYGEANSYGPRNFFRLVRAP